MAHSRPHLHFTFSPWAWQNPNPGLFYITPKCPPIHASFSVSSGPLISIPWIMSLENSWDVSCFHVDAIFSPWVPFMFLTAHRLLFSLYISTFQFYMFHVTLPVQLKNGVRILCSDLSTTGLSVWSHPNTFSSPLKKFLFQMPWNLETTFPI